MAEITSDFSREWNFSMPPAEAILVQIGQLFWSKEFTLDCFYATNINGECISACAQGVPSVLRASKIDGVNRDRTNHGLSLFSILLAAQ
jgi:cell division ATPase FtsA